MRTALALAALLMLALPSPARAEEATSQSTGQAEAWALYEEAFSQAASGQDDAALRTLEVLHARHPGTGAEVLGGELQRFIEGRRLGATSQPPSAALVARLKDYRPPERAAAPGVAERAAAGKVYGSLSAALHDEQPNNGSRAELVLVQTLNGISLGVEGYLAAFPSSSSWTVQTLTGAALLGGAVGAGASLFYSANGVTAGQALSVNSGSAWGAFHGLALSLASNQGFQGLTTALLVGQLAGTVGGHFAWSGLGLSAGDMSLMNSVGLYSLSAVALASLAFNVSFPGNHWATALLLAGDAGLLGGYFLSRAYPMSRGRTLVMDAGALLGGLMGAGLCFLVGLSPAGGGLVGGLGGLALAVNLTRDWDVQNVPLEVGLAPTQHGGGQLVVASRF